MNTRNQHFDHIADQYDHSLPSHVIAHYLHKRLAFITQWAGTGGSALDVGCGTGILAAALADTGWSVIGLDVSHGMLQRMRQRDQVPLQASGSQQPFASSSFDLVYSVATLHHIAEPQLVRLTLQEMYRVCKPNGVIIIWDHNPNNPYWPIIMARVPQDIGEERLIPAQEIAAAFEPYQVLPGFRYSLYRTGFVPDIIPSGLLPTFQKLESLIESWSVISQFLCAHNVVVIRKGSETV